MQIRSVNIYKTPLDNSYSNVVDFINVEQNRKETLLQVFDTSYSHLQFDGLGRSIKRVGNSTLIVLPISYENGRDYNYMIIEDDEQRLFFYFITNIISENDSTINPSATFTLEWDVWNNNIDSFIDVNNTIVKKHYDRILIDGTKRIPNRLVQFSNIDLPKYSEDINFGQRYLPLFAMITLSEMNNIIDYDENNIKPVLSFDLPFYDTNNREHRQNVVLCDGVSNRYNKNVIYAVIGILDTHTNTFVKGYVTGSPILVTVNTNGNLDTWKYSPVIELDPIVNFKFPDSWSSYVNDISFTFHCPYYYDITTEDNVINLTFNINPIIRWSRRFPNKYGFIVGDYIIQANEGYIERYNDYYRVQSYNEIDLNEITGINSYLNNKDTFLTPADHYLIDPITYTPPFTSIYVTYNNENIPLTITNPYKSLFSITTSLRTSQPNFIVRNGRNGYDYNIINSPTSKFIKNSGFLSFGKNSLDNFMLKNGSQIEVSRLSKTVSALTNVSKFGLGIYTSNPYLLYSGGVGLAGDMTGLLSTEATIKDAERTPDEWVTNSGESDIFYQDRIRLTKDYVDRNNPAFKEFMNGVYCQGYSFPSFDTPFKNSRLTFDYVKTSGCNLSPLMINNNDKQKLEEIFDKGVTKWHIWFSNGLLKFNSSLIKDPNTLNNLEITTETNTSFHNWLYGN